MVSVFTTVVLVTAISSRVTTAFQGAQDVEPLPTRGGADEYPREAPEAAEEGAEDEVRHRRRIRDRIPRGRVAVRFSRTPAASQHARSETSRGHWHGPSPLPMEAKILEEYARLRLAAVETRELFDALGGFGNRADRRFVQRGFDLFGVASQLADGPDDAPTPQAHEAAVAVDGEVPL